MRVIVTKIPWEIHLSWSRHMRSAIRQQLTTNDKEIIRHIYFNYYHKKVGSYDRIVCLFMVRSTWYVVWVWKKVNDSTMCWVALVPHARPKFVSLEPLRVWARDACGGVGWWSGEGGTGKCSQCERVQMRESSSNIYWDILLHYYIAAFTSYI